MFVDVSQVVGDVGPVRGQAEGLFHCRGGFLLFPSRPEHNSDIIEGLRIARKQFNRFPKLLYCLVILVLFAVNIA